MGRYYRSTLEIERTRKCSVEKNAKFRCMHGICNASHMDGIGIRYRATNKMNKHRPSTINYERHFSIYVSASEPGLVPRTLWYEQQDMTEERRARSTRGGEKTVNREWSGATRRWIIDRKKREEGKEGGKLMRWNELEKNERMISIRDACTIERVQKREHTESILTVFRNVW